MTDVKRLLAEAAVETPMGDWWTNGLAIFDNINQPVADIEDSPPNAALIVYAVNRLLDYLAAVEALEQTTAWIEQECWPEADYVGQGHNWSMSEDKREMGLTLLEQARAALARLRDEVPA